MVITLSSCSGLSSFIPSLDLSDKQSVSGGGSGNNGIGEAKANINLADNNSKHYERSNIKSNDTNATNTSNVDLGDNKFSIGGKHLDNSIKTNKSTTKTNTNDDNYNASNIVINNAEAIADKIFNFIEYNFNAIIMIAAFILGGYIREKTIKRLNNNGKK